MKPEDRIRIQHMIDAANERKEWLSSSLSHLNKAYSKDEPEYSISLIKEPNLEYKK